MERLVASCLVFLWYGGRHPDSVFKIKPQSWLLPFTSCGLQTTSFTRLCLSYLICKMGMLVQVLSYLQSHCADEVR